MDKNNALDIVYNHDHSIIQIKYNTFLNFKIHEHVFVILTYLYLTEHISIMELCKCYQEQFALID